MEEPTKIPLTAVPLILALAAPAAAKDVMTASRTFRIGDAEAVHVDFPAGDLLIAEGTGSDLRAIMTARCAHGGSRCIQQAREIRLVSEIRGKRLNLELQGEPKFNTHGLSIELRVEVPKALATSVKMGAGELEIRGLERDLDVDMGAGDVTIRMAETAVRSVRLKVGIGETALRSRGERHSGSGFLGKVLRWRGQGSADVDVHLGVGDIGVTLE